MKPAGWTTITMVVDRPAGGTQIPLSNYGRHYFVVTNNRSESRANLSPRTQSGGRQSGTATAFHSAIHTRLFKIDGPKLGSI